MAVYYAKRLWGKSSSIYYLLLFYFSSALFYALIIPWSYRTPPSPSYALQCFANLKDLLVFWFTLLSSRIISPLFVKTTTTMTNAMSTFGGPPSSLLQGRRNPWANGTSKFVLSEIKGKPKKCGSCMSKLWLWRFSLHIAQKIKRCKIFFVIFHVFIAQWLQKVWNLDFQIKFYIYVNNVNLGNYFSSLTVFDNFNFWNNAYFLTALC